MIHTIRVHAEHEYDVVVGCDWQSSLKDSLGSYTRVALVYSSAMRDHIKGFKPDNTEIHYFEVADGEGAKTSQSLQSLWNWLGAAENALQNFIGHFKGQFYVKDAYEKLSWIAYIQGDQAKANTYRSNVISKGNDMTDADKQALQNTKKGTWPHPILLRARLLSDGGYQQQALAILAGKTSNDFEKAADKTEFAYRLGRIYELAGQLDQAIPFYTSAIEKGANQPEYFAARSALQIGLIYEQKGNPSQAITFFNTCLEMKNHAFKNSLDQKAKTGIQRCLRK